MFRSFRAKDLPTYNKKCPRKHRGNTTPNQLCPNKRCQMFAKQQQKNAHANLGITHTTPIQPNPPPPRLGICTQIPPYLNHVVKAVLRQGNLQNLSWWLMWNRAINNVIVRNLNIYIYSINANTWSMLIKLHLNMNETITIHNTYFFVYFLRCKNVVYTTQFRV